VLFRSGHHLCCIVRYHECPLSLSALLSASAVKAL